MAKVSNNKGRPVKDGLDYFPFEVAFFSDKKLRRLKAKFGVFGIMVYIYITAEIYKDKGYYLQLNSGEEDDSNISFDDFVFFIYEYFNEPGTSEDLIKKIIMFCLDIDLFNKHMYKEHFILTSKGIQNRFLKIKRRPRINPAFIVPDVNEISPPPLPDGKPSDFGPIGVTPDQLGAHVLLFDKAFEKLFNDDQWLMNVGAAHDLPKEDVLKYLDKFKKAREGDGDTYKNVIELKRYFNNWVGKVKEKEQPPADISELKKYKNLKPAKK